jgi:hypothetical protein
MTITVKINTDTPAGKRLEDELRLHPEVVEFIDSTGVSDSIPEGFVSLKDGFNQVREHIKSISFRPCL